MQIIDSHIHIDNRNREDLELMAMAGVGAVVTMVWYPTNLVFDSRTMFDYYDRASIWEPARTKAELISTYAGVGISMVSVPTDWENVIERLPEYFKREKVVCIGEIGMEPSSQTCRDLGKQEEIFRAQLQLAKQYDMPVVIHTPFKEQTKWIEKFAGIIEDVGVDKEKVLLDHMQTASVPLAWELGCYAGLTVQPWRNITPADGAKLVAAGGRLDRLLIDSDCSASKASDSLSVPRTVNQMRKLGVDERTIALVVEENPAKFYGLPV